eukprot:1090590-Rhodomonas_salina.3
MGNEEQGQTARVWRIGVKGSLVEAHSGLLDGVLAGSVMLEHQPLGSLSAQTASVLPTQTAEEVPTQMEAESRVRPEAMLRGAHGQSNTKPLRQASCVDCFITGSCGCFTHTIEDEVCAHKLTDFAGSSVGIGAFLLSSLTSLK